MATKRKPISSVQPAATITCRTIQTAMIYWYFDADTKLGAAVEIKQGYLPRGRCGGKKIEPRRVGDKKIQKHLGIGACLGSR